MLIRSHFAVGGSLANVQFSSDRTCMDRSKKNSACFELCSCRLESIVVAVIQKLYLGVSSETLSCPLLCCYSTHLTTERTADAAVITASGRYRSNFPTTAM